MQRLNFPGGTLLSLLLFRREGLHSVPERSEGSAFSRVLAFGQR